MRNPFIGIRDQEQLEGWLAAAYEEFQGGKTIQSFAAGDSQGADFVWKSIDPERRIELLLYRLSQLDAVKYPPADVRKIRVTTARFNDLQP
jgi:hypothetical protein